MKISLEEFKKQLLNDFKTAHIANKITTVLKSSCDNIDITTNCDLAQAALARVLKSTDSCFFLASDLSLNMSHYNTTTEEAIQNIINNNTTPIYNIHVATGLAMTNKTAPTPQGTVVCTIRYEHLNYGQTWEAIRFAAIRQLPLAIILWNDGNEMANNTLMKQFTGFSAIHKGNNSLSIMSITGNEYPTLCQSFAKQLDYTRNNNAPSLTIVESSENAVTSFANWIVEKKIHLQSTIENTINANKETIDTIQAQIQKLQTKSSDNTSISSLFKSINQEVTILDNIPSAINKAIGIALNGRKVLVKCSTIDILQSDISKIASLPITIITTDYSPIQALTLPQNIRIYITTSPEHTEYIYKRQLTTNSCSVIIPNHTHGVSSPKSINTCDEYKVSTGYSITILSWGNNAENAYSAAQILSSNNIKADVVNICSIRPFDPEGIIKRSISKTHKVAIIDNTLDNSLSQSILGVLTTNKYLSLLNSQPIIINHEHNKEMNGLFISNKIIGI